MSTYMPLISLRPATPSPLTQHPPPQEIDPSKFREVRKRLHSYRLAVTLQGDAVPTSLDSSSPFQAGLSSRGSRSSASRTFPPAASEASYATSRTDYTVIWSQQDGSLHPDPKKKSLDPVMKAKKALMRYLGQCSRDCRVRKIKCSLSHHALRDILDGEHDDQAESDVEWALDYDSEIKGADSNSMADDNHSTYELGNDDDMMTVDQNSSTTQMAVIDNVANQLDMPATPVPIYPIAIHEGDFHDTMDEPAHGGLSQYANNTAFQFLDPHHTFPQHQTFNTTRTPGTPVPMYPIAIHEGDFHDTMDEAVHGGLSQYANNTFFQYFGQHHTFPQQPTFNTTLPLATEIVGFDCCLHYKCICSETESFRSQQELLNHAQLRHNGFMPLLPDPMRLVCLNCFKFYAENTRTGICWNTKCSGRLVVNIYGEFYLATEIAGPSERFH